MSGTTDPLDTFDTFASAVRRRLEQGRREYGDSALSRPLPELRGELAEELEDVCGWAFLLWLRVRRIDAATAERGPLSPAERHRRDSDEPPLGRLVGADRGRL